MNAVSIGAGRKRIRLVATDLDGTLLRSDGTVSARTLSALARLAPAGLDLVLVTARPPRWMGPFARMTGHNGVAICANGAIIYDLRHERVLDSRPFPTGAALEIVRRLREAVPGGTFAVESLAGFACEPGHLQHQWDAETDPPTDDVARLLRSPAVKLLFGHPNLTADDLLAVARATVDGLAEVTHSNPERAAIELSAAGVNKATTLARFCAGRGLGADAVLAFGDMPNDLSLLAWAGTSYAVANAHPDVIAAGFFVTASNDEDGVARVLEHMLGQEADAGADERDVVAPTPQLTTGIAARADMLSNPLRNDEMTIGAINPISASQVSAMYPPKGSSKTTAPASTPAPAPASTPAATVQLSGVPSSVDADDKGLYSQVLRSSGANAAMSAVAAQDKREVEG